MAHLLCLPLRQVTTAQGRGSAAWPAWTAPRTRPSRPPRTTHARAQHTQHHAPAGHGLTPTGHQEALLHVAWQRPTTGERERGHGQRAPGRTRGQAPGATGCAAWRPGPPGLPAGLTVHPIVLLVAPLAQDGGGAIVDDGGRPGGRQAAEHARHALHGVGLGRARVGLCREQQAGLAWVRAARWTQAREAEDDSCPPPRDRCPPGVPPACTSASGEQGTARGWGAGSLARQSQTHWVTGGSLRAPDESPQISKPTGSLQAQATGQRTNYQPSDWAKDAPLQGWAPWQPSVVLGCHRPPPPTKQEEASSRTKTPDNTRCQSHWYLGRTHLAHGSGMSFTEGQSPAR